MQSQSNRRARYHGQRRLLLALALFLTGLASTSAALGQGSPAYPSKPVRLVVPFAAGGPNDVMARILAQRLTSAMGQPFVVDNKAGGGGIVGTDAVAKAAPDGYTLAFISGPFTMAPALQAKMPYDTLGDFVGVTKVAESPMVLMVPSTSRFKTAKELVEFARLNPEKLNYGSGGIGSTPHLTTELLSLVTGAKFTHVPYKGGGESIKALMGGEIDLLIDSVTSTGPAFSSGRVKALAVTQNKRTAKLPDVPTFDEAGIRKFTMSHWVGIVAPAKIAPSLLSQLRVETIKALRSGDVEKSLAELGAQPVGDTSLDFQKFLKDELKKWEFVAKTANIKAQ
jgi:tripartite-type tricarboxylate transporter receptor subunit TctC